jgi:hypothetical protein
MIQTPVIAGKQNYSDLSMRFNPAWINRFYQKGEYMDAAAGQPVKHIAFGEGTVTGLSDRAITITFGQDKKKFLYPDAFATYLTINDAQIQRELYEKCARKVQNKRRN